jgi:hypothetical protein
MLNPVDSWTLLQLGKSFFWKHINLLDIPTLCSLGNAEAEVSEAIRDDLPSNQHRHFASSKHGDIAVL